VKTLIEAQYGKVWVDGSSPIVFVQLTQSPTKDECIDKLKITCKKIVKGMHSKFDLSFMVLDLRSFVETAKFLSDFLYFINEDFKKPLTYFSIIKPVDANIHAVISRAINPDRSGAFNSFEEALGKLNAIRVKEMQRQYENAW
jgi:hypothetical protein